MLPPGRQRRDGGWGRVACSGHPPGEAGQSANTASRGVALRAGYRHVPELDQVRRVRAQDWDTVAYRLPAERPGEPTGRPGSGAETRSELPRRA